MIIFLPLAAVLASGCLFEPREAQQAGSRPSTWQVPDLPSKVFLNLESGLEDLDGINYERSLLEAFTFIPLPEDVDLLDPGIFDNWTDVVEKQVVQFLLSDAKKITVAFLNLTQTVNEVDRAQFEGDYELGLVRLSAPDTTETYKAKARLEMRNGRTGWQLSRWEDLEAKQGFPTWGRLRGILRQQLQGT